MMMSLPPPQTRCQEWMNQRKVPGFLSFVGEKDCVSVKCLLGVPCDFPGLSKHAHVAKASIDQTNTNDHSLCAHGQTSLQRFYCFLFTAIKQVFPLVMNTENTYTQVLSFTLQLYLIVNFTKPSKKKLSG